MRFFLIFTLALFNLNTFSQVFSWLPEYPSINDTVIMTYNPSLGNGALMNASNIYAQLASPIEYKPGIVVIRL